MTMDLFAIIPEMGSELSWDFEVLFWYITITTGAVGFAVYAALLYFCVVYRRGATNGNTPRILGSVRLELAWTVTPLFVFLSYFGGGVYIYNKAAHPPEDAMEVFIIGKQWMWKAQYPDGQRVIIGGNPANMTEAERKSIGKLVLPVNRSVRFTMVSEDVIHSFGIPAFRQKVDVLPGRYTTMWQHPTRTGEYHIFCDQYCGTWHSLMVGKVKVVEQKDFDEWLDGLNSDQGTENPVDGSAAFEGRKLFLKLQCIRCHSATPDGKAPVLEGLYKTRVPLRNSGGEIADDLYIKESIRKPKAKVVDGWETIMPAYDDKQVSDKELDYLVAYIRSLKKGTTPDRTEKFPAPVGAPTTREQPPTSPKKPGGN